MCFGGKDRPHEAITTRWRPPVGVDDNRGSCHSPPLIKRHSLFDAPVPDNARSCETRRGKKKGMGLDRMEER